MTINRNFFFDQVALRLFDGKLPAKVKDSLGQVLDYWEAKHAKDDDRWLAYALGTAHHETDRTFGPIREYGRGKGKKYGKIDPQTGEAYYGRGLVQLTWKDNYKKMSPIVGVDLVKNPDKALELKHAIPIMFVGMKQGIFTGKKFADFFNRTREDWVQARKMINGLDKAHLIAGHAKKYYSTISYTTG